MARSLTWRHRTVTVRCEDGSEMTDEEKGKPRSVPPIPHYPEYYLAQIPQDGAG